MKVLTIFAILILTTNAIGQVKFQPRTFENGFKYPHIELSSNKSSEDSINKRILASIADLKASDFCIGEYGFVQKGIHIEIHMFCTCIDLDDSEHRYLLFNTETGEQVKHIDLFDPKQTDKALALLNSKIQSYQASDANCKSDFSKLNADSKFEDLHLRMYKDGIEVRPLNSVNCEKTPLRVTWTEMSTLLRHKYI